MPTTTKPQRPVFDWTPLDDSPYHVQARLERVLQELQRRAAGDKPHPSQLYGDKPVSFIASVAVGLAQQLAGSLDKAYPVDGD